MRRLLKKRLIVFTAAGYFCLTLLLDYLGVGPSRGRLPSTWLEALFLVVAAVVETAIFTFLSYFAMTYLFQRFLFTDQRSNPGGEGTNLTESQKGDRR
jgi:hypothetical protein